MNGDSTMVRQDQATAQGGRPPRSGFTLVELLVVIMIIAMLAALVTPAVMRAQSAARNARIKSEIDMLHMAIMNYKNEYGSVPPGFDNTLSLTSNAGKHLSRLFPRCTNANTQLSTALATASPAYLTGTSAITFWLSGFTSDPSSPLLPLSNRKKMFDFDMSRVNTSSGAYCPPGKSNSPYLYINAALYASFQYAGGSVPGAMRQTYKGDATPFYNVGPETNDWFNPDTFQILCAGSDETFGTDDDLSNFWPATRKEYLDSLNQ